VPSSPIDTNFYHDDQPVGMPHPGNPYLFPDETTALTLVQRYFQTVHTMFPIVPTVVENQLLAYYQMTRSGAYANFSPGWYTMMHLILAIGGRFLHINKAGWHSDTFDESLCIARAYQLLGFTETNITLTPPDLISVQTTGLLALYYLAAGHVKRAWVTIGTAIRFALTIGLHLHDQHSSPNSDQKVIAVQTWWTLYNLETLLCSMVGRPCMLIGDDITATLPNGLVDDDYQKDTNWTPTMAFLDVQVRVAALAQKIMAGIYNERRAPRLWSQTHSVMKSLVTQLDAMGLETVQHTLFPQNQWLQKQHYRLKILMTRPSLGRIKRAVEMNTDDFTTFDMKVASVCIQTAQQIASLFPAEMELKALYETGPWWTIVHNSMSLSILLTTLSCRIHLEPYFPSSLAATKRLISWLRLMAPGNNVARRAFKVVKDIVDVPVKKGPSFWTDIAALFPDD
ncbi:hypothetical protein EK21DRAFT_10952, partial [Setomelanomma holmii]